MKAEIAAACAAACALAAGWNGGIAIEAHQPYEKPAPIRGHLIAAASWAALALTFLIM